MAAHTTTDTLGQRVKARRGELGISVERLRDLTLLRVPGRYVPGVKTFYRIEADEVAEEKVDGILIIGMASVLGCRISDLSPSVADEHERVGDLVASSLPWIPMCPGQLVLLAVA